MIFLQHFVMGTDGNHREEKRNGFQQLQEDPEDASRSLGFVIFLQIFVKGNDGYHIEEKINSFQELPEDQEDAFPSAVL